MKFRQMMWCGLLALPGLCAGLASASAQDYLPGADYSIACENGGNYVLKSGPVAYPGDIVTGHLYLTPRHPLHVRLIPMGVGYRYAGRGVWLDGVRERALLYLRKYDPVACIVARI
jgi:hypothetical protein